MDHHCPWLNNCIGFYNKKFFVQLLFYLLLILFYISITSFGLVYHKIMLLYKTRHSINNELFLTSSILIFAYVIVIILTILNLAFFKFHLKLVLTNSTTIESVDPEKKLENKVNKKIIY